MLCVILSHPNLRRCKVEEMESGRDNEVATGLSGNSPSERKDRSRPFHFQTQIETDTNDGNQHGITQQKGENVV